MMPRNLWLALLFLGPLLGSASGAGGEAPKAFALKLSGKPVPGRRTQIDIRQLSTLKLEVGQDGQVLRSNREAQEYSFSFQELVEEVGGNKILKARYTFSKARQVKNGSERTCSFQGRAVLSARDKGGTKTYTDENGSRVVGEDLTCLEQAIGRSRSKLDAETVFEPKVPVRVGESWSPNLTDLARFIGGADTATGNDMAFDLDSCQAKLTLVSVQPRAGVDRALVKGEVWMAVQRIGPVRFTVTMPMKVELEMETVPDGSLPDGWARMTSEIKGTAPATQLPDVGKTLDFTLTAETETTERATLVP